MGITESATKGLWRGLRTGSPGLVVGAGVVLLVSWLRRNPRRPELLATYAVGRGEEIKIRVSDPVEGV